MRKTALATIALALGATFGPATSAQAACVPLTVNADLGVSPCYSFVGYELCVAVYYETPVTGPGYDNIGPVCLDLAP